MVNILIATNDIKLIKKLINEVLAQNQNIRLYKISTNESETIKILNNSNINITFLDAKIIKSSINEMLGRIRQDKKEKYKNSIVIISNNLKVIKQINKNEMIIDYIMEKSSKEDMAYKINKIISKKDIEVKRKEIIKELEYIRYNLDYKGTNYLIDTILQVYINEKLMIVDNLQNDVYPIIANIHRKSINTIRCNIRHATECMYCECDMKKLKEYFGLMEDEKPTTREVVYTVLSKIS